MTQPIRQPVPEVSSADVERALRRDFDGDDLALASELVLELRSGSIRTTLATLKLADGSVDRLRDATQMAAMDSRDVIASAEYARYMSLADSDVQGRNLAIADDWAEYSAWLSR